MTVWERLEWQAEQAFKTYAEQERLLELYYEVRLGEYEEEEDEEDA